MRIFTQKYTHISRVLTEVEKKYTIFGNRCILLRNTPNVAFVKRAFRANVDFYACRRGQSFKQGHVRAYFLINVNSGLSFTSAGEGIAHSVIDSDLISAALRRLLRSISVTMLGVHTIASVGGALRFLLGFFSASEISLSASS